MKKIQDHVFLLNQRPDADIHAHLRKKISQTNFLLGQLGRSFGPIFLLFPTIVAEGHAFNVVAMTNP